MFSKQNHEKKEKESNNSELSLDFSWNTFFAGFQKVLPYLIILVTTIIAIQMVSPIFKPGIPMNIDLPGKYERIWCFQEFRKETGINSLPTAMCRFKNTGDAVFQAYPPFFYMLIDWVSYLTGLELAFKLVLVFTYFLPAIAAFLLFYFLKKPLAGSFAYTLLLIELGGWHKGGFEETFNVGMSSNTLASGFFVLTLAFLAYFLLNPSNKSFIIMTVSATLMFLSHGLPFVFFMVCLLIFAIIFRKHFLEHWKLWLLFPLIFFLLIGFWLIPYLAKSDQFNPGTITHMDWSGILSFFWKNLNYVTFTLGVLGIISIIVLYFKYYYHKKQLLFENKFFLTLSICIIALILLWFWSMASFSTYKVVFKLGKYLILIRLHAELRSLLFIFAAFFLGYIALLNIRIGKTKAPIGLFIALLLLFFAVKFGYHDLKSHSVSLTTSEHPDFKFQWQLFNAIKDAKGRILTQDTLYNYGNTPSAILSHSFTVGPILTGKEFTGTLPWYYYKYNYEFTEENRVLYKEGRNFTQEETDALMKQANIEYVIAYHPYFRVAFEHYQKVGVLQPYAEKFFPWVVYKTNITPSYFEVSQGAILEEQYNGLRKTYVVVDAIGNTTGEHKGSAILTFKSIYYPNWDVRIDGLATGKIARQDGHMDIIVPAGKHRVEFNYVMLPVDTYSYILPILGIILCVAVWLGIFPKDKRAGKHKTAH